DRANRLRDICGQQWRSWVDDETSPSLRVAIHPMVAAASPALEPSRNEELVEFLVTDATPACLEPLDLPLQIHRGVMVPHSVPPWRAKVWKQPEATGSALNPKSKIGNPKSTRRRWQFALVDVINGVLARHEHPA